MKQQNSWQVLQVLVFPRLGWKNLWKLCAKQNPASPGFTGDPCVGVLSYFAQQEAVRISERTKAGLQRVQSQGKVLGRPDGFEEWKDKLATMQTTGYSQGQMQRETGLAYNTVKSYLKRIQKL